MIDAKVFMFIKVSFDEIQIEFNVNLHNCWTFLYALIDKVLQY